MFTGIIKNQIKIKEKKEENEILTFTLEKPKNLKLKKGQSVSLNGICSTVTNLKSTTFEIDYMPETIEKTTVNQWLSGDLINFEESLRATDFLDGHIVQGHVDTTGTIQKITNKGESKVFEIKIPKEYSKFMAPKGSVSIDGVSLTITDTKPTTFSVALIPYSLKHTNLERLKKGDEVNIETDLLARYLYNLKLKSL